MKPGLRHVAVVTVVLGLGAAVLGIQRCDRRGRTGTVTIDRPLGGGGITLVMPLAGPGAVAYLDSDIRAIRVQLIIRSHERQAAFTARVYEGASTAPLRVEHIAHPLYARVIADAYERERLRLPDESAPAATAIAVTFTLPSDLLRRKQSYVVRLSGADDKPIADYAFTTN